MEDLPLAGQYHYRSVSAAVQTWRSRTSRWCLRISRPAHRRQQIISESNQSTGSFSFPSNLHGMAKTETEVDGWKYCASNGWIGGVNGSSGFSGEAPMQVSCRHSER